MLGTTEAALAERFPAMDLPTMLRSNGHNGARCIDISARQCVGSTPITGKCPGAANIKCCTTSRSTAIGVSHLSMSVPRAPEWAGAGLAPPVSRHPSNSLIASQPPSSPMGESGGGLRGIGARLSKSTQHLHQLPSVKGTQKAETANVASMRTPRGVLRGRHRCWRVYRTCQSQVARAELPGHWSNWRPRWH